MSKGFFIHSAQLLNYASLLEPGAQRTALVDAAERHLAKMRADGLGLPWIHYQAAQIALMRGDRATAMAALDRALDAGYTDVLSFSRDLPWRALDDDPAFAHRRARLAKYAQQQIRIAMEAEGGDGATVVAR